MLITLPIATKDNKRIEEWYSDSTLKTKIANGGDKYTNDKNITLYAKEKVLSITSDIIKVNNNMLSNIPLNTTFSGLLNKISTNAEEFKFMNKKYELQTGNQKIKTGDIIKFDNYIEYTLSVKGDVTGSGTSTVSDVAKLYQFIKGKINSL